MAAPKAVLRHNQRLIGCLALGAESCCLRWCVAKIRSPRRYDPKLCKNCKVSRLRRASTYRLLRLPLRLFSKNSPRWRCFCLTQQLVPLGQSVQNRHRKILDVIDPELDSHHFLLIVVKVAVSPSNCQQSPQPSGNLFISAVAFRVTHQYFELDIPVNLLI